MPASPRSIACGFTRLVARVSVCAISGCSPESRAVIGPGTPTAPVAAVVTTATGDPVSGIVVSAVRLDAAGETVDLTDSLGIAAFDLEDGRWCLSARGPAGPAPRQVAGSTGRVGGRPPGSPDTVLYRLQLAAEAVASGSATLAGRGDHSGTTVALAGLAATVTTGPSGAWEFTGLPPGVWTVLVEHAGFQSAAFDLIVPAPGDTVSRVEWTLQPTPLPGNATRAQSPVRRPRSR